MKKFKLTKEQILPLVDNGCYCFASDKITVDGFPVRFMYRERPDEGGDSGWRFFSGLESDEYANNADNVALYSVNTIANYDRSIIPLLDSAIGSVFEKTKDSVAFVKVTDWQPPID